MSGSLKRVVGRAVQDVAFRQALRYEPARALAGVELTPEERSAITTADPARLSALGVDHRMSKAFALGATGDASKAIIADDLGKGAFAFSDEVSPSQQNLRRIEQDINVMPAMSVQEAHAAMAAANLRRIEQDLDTSEVVCFCIEEDLSVDRHGIPGGHQITEY